MKKNLKIKKEKSSYSELNVYSKTRVLLKVNEKTLVP